MKEFLTSLNINQELLFTWASNLALNIVLCILILIFGFWISKRLSKVVGSLLKRRDAEEGLITFLSNFTSIITRVITVFLAISQLGVAMTSFVTLLGAVGIAFGVAFGGILSNFAGGVLILIIKPFKLRDTINALTVTGEVVEIQMFNTFIRSVDNKITILPNGPLVNGVIVNFTREGIRRVDITLPVAYANSEIEVMRRVQEHIDKHPLVLKEPAKAIYFSEFDAQSGKLNINCWVETSNYVQVHRELSNAFFSWIEPLPPQA